MGPIANRLNWQSQYKLLEEIPFDASYYELTMQIRQSVADRLCFICANTRLKKRLKEAVQRLREASDKYLEAHFEFNELIGRDIDDLTDEQGAKLINDIEKGYVQIKWLKIEYDESEKDYYTITGDLQRNGDCQS
jgi:hypothetical protein